MVGTGWFQNAAPSKQAISSKPRAELRSVECPRQVPTMDVVLDAQDETSRWINQRLQSLSEMYQKQKNLKTNLRAEYDNRRKPMGVLHQPKPRRLRERPAWLDDPSAYDIRVVAVERSPLQPLLSSSTLCGTQAHEMTESQEPDPALKTMDFQEIVITTESRMIGVDQFGVLIPTSMEQTFATSATQAHEEGPAELWKAIQIDPFSLDAQSANYSSQSEESLTVRRGSSLSTASSSHKRVLGGMALQTGPSDPDGYGIALYPAAETSSYITSTSTTDEAEESNREMRWLEEGMLEHQQVFKTSKLALRRKYTQDCRARFSKVLGKRKGPL
ncbi:hypothetical protein NEOLEDRAFT_746640 [Neolentinus lepideus HHB14362 ss-1]|uniref:Uncharacterized protein n=1 Tax=Neolentinus lepideus HHB14362 ss-1 TaxID=1314782 RepID=A0A165PT85_9AGAM|nr:hypothetical protein NEOLEDRAFT_746640 [Neolentinus lepideus HHB14362 ss-1]